MKKNVYALIDTETAEMNKVYDFGYILFDKKESDCIFVAIYLVLDCNNYHYLLNHLL